MKQLILGMTAFVFFLVAWVILRTTESPPAHHPMLPSAETGSDSSRWNAERAQFQESPQPVDRDPVSTGSGHGRQSRRGRVLGLHGAPIAGAPILRGETVITRTDSGGWFALPENVTPHRLDVGGPWIAVLKQPVPGDQPLRIRFVAALRSDLKGTVTDRDGIPLPDTAVEPRRELMLTEYPYSLEGAWGRIPEATATDADGHFSVTDLAVDATRIEFRKDQYTTKAFAVTAGSPSFVHVVMEPLAADGPRIRGIVFDPGGQPIAGARVGLGSREVRTGSVGQYEIAFSSGSETRAEEALWAASAGLRTVVIADFGARVAESGGDLYQDLSFEGPGLEIAGRVVYHNGDPAIGLVVFPWRQRFVRGMETALDLAAADDAEPLSLGAARPRSYARTATDGSFRLGGFSDRTYQLRVFDDRRRWGFTTEPISAGDEGVTVRLPPDLLVETVTGRVVTPDGDSVAGLPVRVLISGYENGNGSVFLDDTHPSIHTDDGGRFALSEVSRHGTWLQLGGVSVGGDHYLSRMVTIPPAGEVSDLELVVERRCRFRVVLTDKDFANAEIHLLDGSGKRVSIHEMVAGSVGVRHQASLRGGKSIELGTSEKATTLVAVTGERELRIPIQLRLREVVTITH